jgi:type VI secretion system protein ImpA
MQAAASGRPLEGVELLSREIVREHTGRGRFHRKVQLAQLFLAIGREQMAYPILHELATEIEERRLEEWEASDAIAHPLTLLFRCLGKLDGNSEEKQRLYSRICRLDPVQAMSCSI